MYINMYFIHYLYILLIINIIDAKRSGYGNAGCQRPTLNNGYVKPSNDGKGRVTYRFNCNRPYKIVGPRSVGCLNGLYDADFPICIKRGCPAITSIPNGVVISDYNNAKISFECNKFYLLDGTATITCNGRKWNDTVPTCIDASTINHCEFEDDELCGWETSNETNESVTGLRWYRFQPHHKTPSSYFYNPNAPDFDHTFGEGVPGKFMIAGKIDNSKNERAILYSPIYKDASQFKCFTLWYYMKDSSLGSLKIYQNYNGIQPTEPDKTITTPTKTWTKIVVPIQQVSSSLQILIEAEPFANKSTGIAIDDVTFEISQDSCNLDDDVGTTLANNQFDYEVTTNSEVLDKVATTAIINTTISALTTAAATTTQKITETTEKPTTTTSQTPTTTTLKPTTVTFRPTAITPIPSTTTQKLTTTTPLPTTSTQIPTTTTPIPTTTTPIPTKTTQKPSTTTKISFTTLKKYIKTSQKPSTTLQIPSKNTQKPTIDNQRSTKSSTTTNQPVVAKKFTSPLQITPKAETTSSVTTTENSHNSASISSFLNDSQNVAVTQNEAANKKVDHSTIIGYGIGLGILVVFIIIVVTTKYYHRCLARYRSVPLLRPNNLPEVRYSADDQEVQLDFDMQRLL